MLNTPEYVAAHLRDLVPKAGSEDMARHRQEAIARYRSDRRRKLARLAASLRRAIPLVNRIGRTEVTPSKPKLAT
jgi:hypothetical protein